MSFLAVMYQPLIEERIEEVHEVIIAKEDFSLLLNATKLMREISYTKMRKLTIQTEYCQHPAYSLVRIIPYGQPVQELTDG